MPILRITSGWALTNTPRAATREQHVEARAVASVHDRVDPDEYAVELREPCPHGVEDIVLIDHWLRIHPDVGECGEDGLELAGV